MNFKLLCFVSLLFAIAVGACKEEPSARPPSQKETTKEKSTVKVPAFKRDSAYRYVQEQLLFGARVPGSDAHELCANYLLAKLESLGWESIRQEFTATRFDKVKIEGINVIGRYRPELRNRIVLAAHWDSRFIADHDSDPTMNEQPVPGANDGASGVAVLLECARLLGSNPVDQGVDIVFFDAEDQGDDSGNNPQSWGLGAQHWSRNPHCAAGLFDFGILLDMVGRKNARFGREGFSELYAKDVLDRVWRRAQNMGYNQYFVNEATGGITDDHYFVNTIAKIPMIDIIDRPRQTQTGFFSHWHTTGDDLSVIDKNTLRAVGQVVTAVVYKYREEKR